MTKPQENFDYEESREGLHSALDRLSKLCKKGAAQLIRVSSARQAKESQGSLRFQAEQVRYMELYRIELASVRDLRRAR